MIQTFSFNLLLNNARFYLTSSSGTPLGSHNNSYESLKDALDVPFSTPSSSPRTPGFETLPSQPTLPSLASPIATPTAIQPSLSPLPFASSQPSLKPDPTTPSLLDTSISFARMMDRTGSPASFLTCSSGWDPGIVCGAVKFPSLLHSSQSVENFGPTQETHRISNEPKVAAECSLLENILSRASQSPPKVSFSVATPFYLSPSLRNGEFERLQPSDFATSTRPRTALTPLLPSPTNSEYSASSPQTTSPGSVFSLWESTTSSIYHDPFHWDTVLAGLPQRSPVLPTTISEQLSIRLSTPITSVPSFGQCHEITTPSPQRDSIYSTARPDGIPTIVVRGPDYNMVPIQASVSSIIGLYGGRPESTHGISGKMPALELQAQEAPELDSDSEDTDGEGSSPESEFEIVTVPALKVRLDDILESDRVDVDNAFGSLMSLGSLASGNPRTPAAEEHTSTGFLANGRDFSFSSVTEQSVGLASLFSSGQILQSNPKVSTSTSFASTAKLCYAQSGTSISGQSTISSWNPTVSESESDCPWLFCVEDGKILELPRSASAHGIGKFADKLARFPNVPKSPQLTPLPSPFASPPLSPSPTNRYFFDGPLLPPEILKKKPIGLATLGGADAGPLLSPYWGRNTVECTTTLPHGASTLSQPAATSESSEIEGISFGELDVDVGLSKDFGSLVSGSLPTDSSSSSRYSTKLSTAQSATLSHNRHVRFEPADFRISNMMVGSKRYSPHHRRPPLDRSKTCLKKKRWNEKVQDRKDSSETSTALVRSPGIDCDRLPSSFSSGSISKKGSWWRRGRFLIVIGRVRRGIGGCLSSREEDVVGESVAWATERDYWNEHLPKGESHSGDPTQVDDGTDLLRRARRYS